MIQMIVETKSAIGGKVHTNDRVNAAIDKHT
jgi:hypothetical protein